jgi:hypothetical protein
MRGRYPAGPEYVAQLDGSAPAKERLQVVLETLAGRCRVQEACRQLGIGEVRFHQLRARALQAALDRLEARPAGRPAQPRTAEAVQIGVLEEQVADLAVELRAAQVREEIALVLPQVVRAAGDPGKKTRRPPPK